VSFYLIETKLSGDKIMKAGVILAVSASVFLAAVYPTFAQQNAEAVDSLVRQATKLRGDPENVGKLSDLAAQNAKTRTDYFKNFSALKIAAQNPRAIEEVKALLLRPITKTNIVADPVFQRNNAKLIGAAAGNGRIIGIDSVLAPEFPDCFSVVVEMNDKHYLCTGTLVSPNVIVTAGHCCDGTISGAYNALDTMAPRLAGEYVNVAQVIRHPRYDPRTLRNDIAVLILEKPLTSVSPRAFAPAGALNGVSTVRVVGYGATNADGTKGSGVRREVDVAIVNPVGAEWPQKAVTYGCDPDLEFVATKDRFGSDTCDGDSGGPAYVRVNGQYCLVGATSRPIKDAQIRCGSGGVYERLEKYEEWVKTESLKHGGIW
jgi:hypothetical protein